MSPARCCRAPQLAARTAGDDANRAANLRPARQQLRRCARRGGNFRAQDFARHPRPRAQTDQRTFLPEERPQCFPAQRPRELRVVAELRMHIQGQVRAIDRQVVRERFPLQLPARPRPRHRVVPEQAVVNKEQIRLRSDGQLHRGEARVHRCRNAGDAPVVPDLKAVVRPVPVVDLGRAQERVAVADKGGERGGCHARREAQAGVGVKRET